MYVATEAFADIEPDVNYAPRVPGLDRVRHLRRHRHRAPRVRPRAHRATPDLPRLRRRRPLSARVMELNLNAKAAAAVWGLVSEVQYEADYEAAHVENRVVDLLADLDAQPV